MRRRAFLATAAAALAAPAGRARAGTASLLDAARALAGRAYVPNTTPLPPPFAGLDYDAYRGIRPREGLAATLPQGPGWVADLLPPGLYFPDPVRIDLPSGEVPFSPALFSFEPRYFGTIPATAPGAGFSGLRLRHALNAPGRMDEVMVVQGASYFRAIGRAMAYGLSARAVAIGTGGAGPEEFPRFTRLRLHPAAGRHDPAGGADRQPLARRAHGPDAAARRGYGDGRVGHAPAAGADRGCGRGAADVHVSQGHAAHGGLGRFPPARP
jgi:periplasmic glucans biosynthesis protein